MKKYERPSVEFENVNIEDILKVSGIDWSNSNLGFNLPDETI